MSMMLWYLETQRIVPGQTLTSMKTIQALASSFSKCRKMLELIVTSSETSLRWKSKTVMAARAKIIDTSLLARPVESAVVDERTRDKKRRMMINNLIRLSTRMIHISFQVMPMLKMLR